MTDQHEIERMAPALGRDAAERIDPDRVTERVLARLRRAGAEEVSVVGWPRTAWLRAAAVAAVLIGGGLVMREVGAGPGTGAGIEPIGPYALDELSSTELDEVLDSLTDEAPVADVIQAGFFELDETQLQELLRQMEG